MPRVSAQFTRRSRFGAPLRLPLIAFRKALACRFCRIAAERKVGLACGMGGAARGRPMGGESQRGTWLDIVEERESERADAQGRCDG